MPTSWKNFSPDRKGVFEINVAMGYGHSYLITNMCTCINSFCLYCQPLLPLSTSPSHRSHLTMWHCSGHRRAMFQACWKSTTSLHSCFPLFVDQTCWQLHSRTQKTNWPRTVWTLNSLCHWMHQMSLKSAVLRSNLWLNTDTTASKWQQWPMLELESIQTGTMCAPWLEVRTQDGWSDLLVSQGGYSRLVILYVTSPGFPERS